MKYFWNVSGKVPVIDQNSGSQTFRVMFPKPGKNILDIIIRKFFWACLLLFGKKFLIVYYTTRAVKSWPVQSTCKLPPEP